MLTDFLEIKVNQFCEYNADFICLLPEPDLLKDDEMVECGIGNLHIDFPEEYVTLEISFYDNLEDLSKGDFYDRKNIIVTILDVLSQYIDFSREKITVYVKDFQGIFNGSFYDI